MRRFAPRNNAKNLLDVIKDESSARFSGDSENSEGSPVLGCLLSLHLMTTSSRLDGGDISCLWTNAGWNNEVLPETAPLYYSSRGEDCPPRLDATFGKYLGDNEEYAYLFANGKWVCYNNRRWDDKFLQQVEIPVAVAA